MADTLVKNNHKSIKRIKTILLISLTVSMDGSGQYVLYRGPIRTISLFYLYTSVCHCLREIHKDILHFSIYIYR